MKLISVFIFMLFSLNMAYSQQDTIVTTSERIVGTVREITIDAVKFSYPGEDMVNTIYKNTVDKITFKSGRVQKFAESTSLKTINGPEDFENVSVTNIESEVNGLYKLANVSSTEKGATTISNVDRVKERAYRKLKMEAAMNGANVVFLTQQGTWGNQIETDNQAGISTETNLDGVAYTNKIPRFEEFNARTKGYSQYNVITRLKLWGGGTEMKREEFEGILTINNITNENGLIMMDGTIPKIKVNKFRVVFFNETNFVLVYEYNNTIYNVVVSL